MKERPIPFNSAMVRAILAGTKTQTRRVMKAVKHPDFGNLYEPSCMAREEQHAIERACPYGQPGDRLWVRETFATTCERVSDGAFRERVIYRADLDQSGATWRRSIHMPRWASRITLEITSVRVERLQEISEADALVEGIPSIDTPGAWTPPIPANPNLPAIYRGEFCKLWSDINGADSWDTNPWVWVVEFKRVEQQR